jgi:hypothetical protein
MEFKKVTVVNSIRSLGNQLLQIVITKYPQDQEYNIDDSFYNFYKFSDRTTKRELESN